MVQSLSCDGCRSVVLRLASVVVLVVSLQTKISACREDTTDGSSQRCHNCKEIRVSDVFIMGVVFCFIASESKPGLCSSV